MKLEKMKKTIMNIRANEITNFSAITEIVSKIYNVTGKKASVNFNGSKGYLDHVEIMTEDFDYSKNHENRINIILLKSSEFLKYGFIGICMTEKGIVLEFSTLTAEGHKVVTWNDYFEDYMKTQK